MVRLPISVETVAIETGSREKYDFIRAEMNICSAWFHTQNYIILGLFLGLRKV